MPAALVHNTVDTQAYENSPTRMQIRVSTTVVYSFLSGQDEFSYCKSTDGGATWGAAVDIGGPSVDQWHDIYYERWNNAAGRNIVHIARIQSPGNGQIIYSQLNLDSDTASSPVVVGELGFTGHYSNNAFALARDGSLYVCASGGIYANVVRAHRSVNDGVTWTAVAGKVTEAGDPALNDRCELWADFASSDPADLIGIYHDASANELSIKRYDASADTVTETAIGTIAGAFSTAMDRATGQIKIAAFSASGTGSNNLKTWSVYGATATARTNVLSATTFCSAVAMAVCADGIRVYYGRDSAGASTSVEVYVKLSADDMVTWGVETAYGSRDSVVTAIKVDPYPSGTEVGATYLEPGALDVYSEAPGSVIVVEEHTAFVLMLAEEATPDEPELNITPQNIGAPGSVFTKMERGRERAVLGEQPRAGAGSTVLANEEMARYDVEHPLPGLALRLNKFVDEVEYNLGTVDIDVPQHHMTNWRPVVNLNGFGRLSRLSGRKVTTPLYEGITTGAAINAVLDAASFPAALRVIAAGTVTLNYFWCTEDDALSMLNKLVTTEGITAELYEDGRGRLVFRDRNARYTEARSTTAMNTFRISGAHPWLSGFEYHSGYREIVNQARHIRKTRLTDSAPSVVWSEAANYLLGAGQVQVVIATSSEPFKNAITPVLDTDYNVAIGSLASVTLNQTSGTRVEITFTAGASGALFGFNNTTLTAMQLRATSIPQLGSDIIETSTVDASASIAQYGLKPWTGEMWPDVEWYVIRDNLDAILMWKMERRGRITIKVEASIGIGENLATAERTIGDRVRVIESELGVDAQCWIERVEHEVISPARHVASYELSVIDADITTNPYDSIDNSVNDWPDPFPAAGDDGLLLRGVSIL